MIYQVINEDEKKEISREILQSLPNWFGIDSAREKYILESGGQTFFAAKNNEKNIAFLCLKRTGKSTVELAVMGVLESYHRQGIGTKLFGAALAYAKNEGYEFVQVKTVAMGYYDNYDNTNRFYQSLGFKELEIFPTLWGKNNPCQIYIMSIANYSL